MSEIVTLSAKFEIQIPEALRAARGWKVGQVFALMPKGTGILLIPVPEQSSLAGSQRVLKRPIAGIGRIGSDRQIPNKALPVRH